MKSLGNILWHFPFFGFVNAIVTYLFGLLLTVTVVAAPIGLGLMELGKFLFAPFGHAMISKSKMDQAKKEAIRAYNTSWNTYSAIIMILYLPIGLILAVITIFQVAFLFISIIGIPPAIVIAKTIGTFFNPVYKVCVTQAVADEIDRRVAINHLDS